jgi:hypothetical protein
MFEFGNILLRIQNNTSAYVSGFVGLQPSRVRENDSKHERVQRRMNSIYCMYSIYVIVFGVRFRWIRVERKAWLK